MPAIYKIGYEMDSESPRFIPAQEMQQLLEITYTRLAAAVEKLAGSSPALDRHIARMPDEVVLRGDCDLRPQISPLRQVPNTAILMFSPDMLPLQSTDELLCAMCRGLAPAVLQHKQEVDSWTMVNNGTLCFHVYALRAAGVRWSLALALPAAVWKIAGSIIRTWLPRQQEYEADEVAAVTSTAAGCSPESILTSMQRAYCAAWAGPQAEKLKERSNRTKH